MQNIKCDEYGRSGWIMFIITRLHKSSTQIARLSVQYFNSIATDTALNNPVQFPCRFMACLFFLACLVLRCFSVCLFLLLKVVSNQNLKFEVNDVFLVRDQETFFPNIFLLPAQFVSSGP